MPDVTQKPYAGDEDLRAMQRLVQSIWSLESRFHVGDLAWQRSQGRDKDWPTMLWQEGGETVAWGWAHPPCHLYLAVHRDRAALACEVLDWFERAVDGDELSVDVLDREAHLIEALLARGFRRREDGPFDLYVVLDLDELQSKPRLPMGLLPRVMAEAPDVEKRVASHRAAWHPSAMTLDRYKRVMAAPPYDPKLDWMIEIADGRFVANCCIWHDRQNGVGLVEPVGVDPGFRRLGLARAVVLNALHALRDKGAKRAIVYPRGDEIYPFTKPLYLGLGFKPYARTIIFLKRR
jgi:GNAT superfamily N-acetyltransferase